MNDSKWKQEFARRLCLKMAQWGMSQTDLSKASGIDGSQISRYISGSNIPSAKHVAAMAMALRCAVDELVGFIVKD